MRMKYHFILHEALLHNTNREPLPYPAPLSVLIASTAVPPPLLPYSTNTICPNTSPSSLFPKQKATFALQTNQTQINIAHLGLHRKNGVPYLLNKLKKK
jgi:hypothetical protein